VKNIFEDFLFILVYLVLFQLFQNKRICNVRLKQHGYLPYIKIINNLGAAVF